MSNLFENLKQKIADAAGMAIQWVDEGYELEKVPENTAMKRLNICQACVNYDQENQKCKVCLCFMPFKVTLKYDPIKSGMALKKVEVQCPKKYW